MSNMAARGVDIGSGSAAKKATTTADILDELTGLRTIQNAIVERLDGIEGAAKATNERLDSVDTRLESLEATLAKIDQRTLDIRRAVLSRS